MLRLRCAGSPPLVGFSREPPGDSAPGSGSGRGPCASRARCSSAASTGLRLAEAQEEARARESKFGGWDPGLVKQLGVPAGENNPCGETCCFPRGYPVTAHSERC